MLPLPSAFSFSFSCHYYHQLSAYSSENLFSWIFFLDHHAIFSQYSHLRHLFILFYDYQFITALIISPSSLLISPLFPSHHHRFNICHLFAISYSCIIIISHDLIISLFDFFIILMHSFISQHCTSSFSRILTVFVTWISQYHLHIISSLPPHRLIIFIYSLFYLSSSHLI